MPGAICSLSTRYRSAVCAEQFNIVCARQVEAVRAAGDDLLQAIASANAVGSADLGQQVSSLN